MFRWNVYDHTYQHRYIMYIAEYQRAKPNLNHFYSNTKIQLSQVPIKHE